MLKEIDDPEKAQKWMLDALHNKKKIIGFGHRIYRNADGRVPTMKKYAHAMADFTNEKKWSEIAAVLEETMLEEKNIYPQ